MPSELENARENAALLGHELMDRVVAYLKTKNASVAEVVAVLETIKFTLLLDHCERGAAGGKG